jgi:predicted MFS family arabinose efflux permease
VKSFFDFMAAFIGLIVLSPLIIVVTILALTQFSVVLDFMVMSPLGDILIKSMKISPKQFGIVVSSYAISAGISGFLTASFADKFDRKKLFC